MLPEQDSTEEYPGYGPTKKVDVNELPGEMTTIFSPILRQKAREIMASRKLSVRSLAAKASINPTSVQRIRDGLSVQLKTVDAFATAVNEPTGIWRTYALSATGSPSLENPALGLDPRQRMIISMLCDELRQSATHNTRIEANDLVKTIYSSDKDKRILEIAVSGDNYDGIVIDLLGCIRRVEGNLIYGTGREIAGAALIAIRIEVEDGTSIEAELENDLIQVLYQKSRSRYFVKVVPEKRITTTLYRYGLHVQVMDVPGTLESTLLDISRNGFTARSIDHIRSTTAYIQSTNIIVVEFLGFDDGGKIRNLIDYLSNQSYCISVTLEFSERSDPIDYKKSHIYLPA